MRWKASGMDETAIMDGLTATFRTVFEDAALSLTPDMTAADIAGWDSLRMILILASLEERFDLQFTTREMDSLRCVGDLVRVIAEKLAAT
jgi:acyl carrier protein